MSGTKTTGHTEQGRKPGQVRDRGDGPARQIVVGRVGAVDPYGGEAEMRRAVRVPAVRRQEADLVRLDAAARLDQAIDPRIGLEDLRGIDAQHGLEAISQPGRGDHRIEHLGVAVGQDGEPQAGTLQAVEHRRHLGEGGERKIGLHELVAHGRVSDAVGRQAMIERLAGHLPEFRVRAHGIAQPGVLDLLGAPQIGQRVGFGPDQRAMPRDRRIEVEQRAVGVEHAEVGTGQG